MIEPWPLVGSRQLLSNKIFRVREDRRRPPRDAARSHDFWVIEAADWSNIIAITPEREIVLVEQWRHGIGAVSLEIPGGIVDPGEDPAAAAARELLEETGFAAGEVRPLGVCHPNPALQTNRLHTFLAENVRRGAGAAPRPDSTEELETRLVPLAMIDGLVRGGAITHALVLAALHFYRLAGLP